MCRLIVIAGLIVLAGLCAAGPGRAQDDSGPYDIMRPEPTPPGVIPSYKSPRGTKQRVSRPRPPPSEVRRIPGMPPPIVSPRTGVAMPNIPPPVPGSGPGGAESFQDRATRCVHQSGVYGTAPGAEQGAYITTCINQ